MDLLLEHAVKIALTALGGTAVGLRGRNVLPGLSLLTFPLIGLAACLIMLVSLHPIWEPVLGMAGDNALVVAATLGVIGAAVILGQGGSAAAILAATALWIAGILGIAFGVGLFLEGTLVMLFAYVALGLVAPPPDEAAGDLEKPAGE